jgi:hypothetical protein
MDIRFDDTTLQGDRTGLRLLDRSGKILLQLRAHEIEDAIRTGFIDPENYHYSMFEYFRMKRELGPMSAQTDPQRANELLNPHDAVSKFLASLKFRRSP